MMRFRWPFLVALTAVAAAGAFVAAGRPAQAVQNTPVLELVFTYGSEKKQWLTDVTKDYNSQRHTVVGPAGRQVVQVRLVAMGSGECMDALLPPDAGQPGNPKSKYTPDPANLKAGEKGELGADEAHITSPASKAYIQLANAEWKEKTGSAKPLVDLKEAKNLVLSPIVVAMWESRARALGWPDGRIGWADIIALARTEEGWGVRNGEPWGRFKFAHTHPQFSNSGLMTVIALAYAGANKTEKLTVADVQKPGTRKFIADIEKAAEFYGQSTGFLKDTMVQRGLDGLHAAVLYESLVFEANDPKKPLAEKLVAIYPHEGTFMSQHPVGVVERDHVTPTHREAARHYIDFLLAEPQQVAAAKSGFRPAKEVNWDKQGFNQARGVKLELAGDELELPSAEVMKAVSVVWGEEKKPVRVVLAIDVSGSMAADMKLIRAKKAAQEFVERLDPRDELSLLAFDNTLAWPIRSPMVMTKEGKAAAKLSIGKLAPLGNTSLYDAVGESVDELRDGLKKAPRSRVPVVVVLSDGEDTSSKVFPDVMGRNKEGKLVVTVPGTRPLNAHIAPGREGANVRVFTIAYGTDAKPKILESISKATSGKQFDGNPDDIGKVLRSILTEF